MIKAVNLLQDKKLQDAQITDQQTEKIKGGVIIIEEIADI